MSAIQQVLNTIRTVSLKSEAQRDLLEAVDLLESEFTRLETTLTTTHEMLGSTQQKVATLSAENNRITQRNQFLEELHKIALVQRFARSSEKWTPDDLTQGLLFNEIEVALASAQDEAEAHEITETQAAATPARKKPAKARGKRTPLPETLELREERIELPEDQRWCDACGKTMVKIGEEVSERLEVIPARYYRRRIIRDTFACSCGDCQPKSAPLPAQVYPKSILGDSVLTQAVVGKFCDALPFYRMERIFGRSGIDISRQTMARAAQALAQWMRPMVELIAHRLSRCRVVCADETRLRVLSENGIKKEGNSWMWVATGRDEKGELRRFMYGSGRGAEPACQLLGGITGATLMCDGYGVYPKAVKGMEIRLAACMAHVRRKFHEVYKAESKNPHANHALSLIAALYLVEREARDQNMDDAQRQEHRNRHAKPVFAEFKSWLLARSLDITPQSGVGRAVSYALGVIERLAVYLDDGSVPIDNNAAENAIRPFVVGRKNWLFSAEIDGAKASADLFSIIETAKANEIEPAHYLQFLIRCANKFGYATMPWDELAPQPELREKALQMGISWGID